MSWLIRKLQLLLKMPMSLARGLYWRDARPLVKSFIYVVLTSTFLQESNLFDFSTPAQLKSVKCSAEDLKYRKADGSCNSAEFTAMGMKGSRLGRNVRSDYETETPPDSMLFSPPVEVAAGIMTGTGNKQAAHDGLNLLFGTWIQFMTHDWFDHDVDETATPFELQTRKSVEEDGIGKGRKTFKLQPTKRDAEGYMQNNVTQWWDMSQLYGSDQATQNSVRSFVDGKLAIGADGLIPKDPATGIPITGFNNNWWTGLELLHTLFTKEHNYICDELKKQNPTWDDEKLFQTARLINAAEAAVIHTQDWTPILLQNRGVSMALHTNIRGINWMREVEFAKELSFWDKITLRKLSILPVTGINGIGDKVDLKGVPFSQTEDFACVYRMHALLPEEMKFDDGVSSLLDNSFSKGRDTAERLGMSKVIKGFAEMKTTKLTTHNFPASLSHLKMTDGRLLDMASVDIFRDRERGIPRFNEFREKLGLKRFKTFEDITEDKAVVAELKKVYKNVDEIDTQVGMAAESPLPHGFAISETAFMIFVVQTTRRLHTDRFYQENFNAETYTKWGVKHSLDARLRGLFERHYPEVMQYFPKEGSVYLRK